MKMKSLLVALLALAGRASAFAIASPSQADGGHHGKGHGTTGTTTGTSTGTSTGTTTGEHHHGNSSCQRVELRGTNGSGSVAFTRRDRVLGGQLVLQKRHQHRRHPIL